MSKKLKDDDKCDNLSELSDLNAIILSDRQVSMLMGVLEVAEENGSKYAPELIKEIREQLNSK